MSEHFMSFRRRLRGGGLIANDPLVLSSTDFSGGAYVAADYEGSYLVSMNLKDIATMIGRVKKWKVSVTVDLTLGGSSSTYTSSDITTPSTVYELVHGAYDDTDPTNTDWSGSLYVVPDENYHDLEKGTSGRSSRPFKQIDLDGAIATDHDFNLTIRPARGYESFDYYMQTLADLEDCFTLKPTDAIYLPLAVSLNYFNGVDLGADVRLEAYSKISDSNIDWDKADLTKISDAISLTFLGVDTTADIYWGEPTGEGITVDSLEVNIEAAEYWSYGGRFNTTTGKPI